MSTLSIRPVTARIRDTFWSPQALFTELRDHPRWAAPLLVGLALGVTAPFLIPDEVVLSGLRDTGSMEPSTAANLGRLLMVVGVLLRLPLQMLLLAGIATVVFTLLLEGRGRFSQYAAVASHALLISTFGMLAVIPVQIAGGRMDVEYTLALLTPFLGEDTFVYYVLERVHVFTLWMLGAMGLGTAIVNGTAGWARHATILIGLYVALQVTIVALAR